MAIEVEGLSKAYGRNAALRKVDLAVRWGEVLTVLGPNGSGKTTLVKVLATLTRPDEGRARIAGLDLNRLGGVTRRMVGVVTHDPLLYQELTGYENLKFVGRMFGLDRIDERIKTLAEALGLTAKLEHRVATLSHGMRKRLTIARALLHDPLVLLMDEPETGLDQEAVAMLDAVIRDRSRAAQAILMTTHNLDRGIALGDRVAILAKGRLVHEEPIISSSASDVLRNAYYRHTGDRP
jgi:ABC-type multidrug transport system ATPase subunit